MHLSSLQMIEKAFKNEGGYSYVFGHMRTEKNEIFKEALE